MCAKSIDERSITPATTVREAAPGLTVQATLDRPATLAMALYAAISGSRDAMTGWIGAMRPSTGSA
jgi:hypothetical protein